MLTEPSEIEQSNTQVIAHLGIPQVHREQMQEVIGECLERMRYRAGQEFIFDMERVEFISSGCIGVLVEFLQEVEHVRGRISLLHCNEHIMSLFKVTKLDTVFDVQEQ